ncbi:SH3 domain-containing kinase-binding protein 1 isoform X2 [Polyodon spathula]|uniref:SH3 domain-containing kinase-binding protein 1 isoform X2 n=1 Tax=Polyodon spathula TaxID=7913 RepID=UPI001B7E4BFF|nr:SH3 domain-containing kinase-binding protein 1 isoform X2 [Polyodon spathula]
MVEAIVEFDYKAQHDDELTITVGDIITNIKKDDGGWWEGETNGKRGLFPDNFVRELKKDVKKESQAHKQAEKPGAELSNGSSSVTTYASLRKPKEGEKIRKKRCKAAFSYAPQNDDELELKVGDVIEVSREVEEGWWEGTLNGKTGIFPSNFIKELPVELEDAAATQEEKSTRTNVKDSTGSESDGGDSCSSKSEGGSVASASEIQPKKVKGIGFGDIFKDKPIKLRPRSMDVDSELGAPSEKSTGRKVPSSSGAQEPVKADSDSRAKATAKEYCKVTFPYEAQNEDELTIKEGDVVAIISKDCADVGWWRGELGGRQGVFPDNFVKLLPPDVEKERPKKPPPPAAPAGRQTQEKKPDVKKAPPERPESLPNKVEEKDKQDKDVKDLSKPALPTIPPKKPLPPKTNSLSRPTSFPPKRPERPVVPAPNIRCESPKSEAGSGTLASTPERDSAEKSNDIDIEDFDTVVPTSEKLCHPTATRPRVTDRRPRSQIFTSSSLSSSDLADSPPPEEDKHEKDRGREEQDSASPKPLEAGKGAPRPIQGADLKAGLPLKPAAPVPALSSSRGGIQSALHPGGPATGHRPNSPSHIGHETKPKNDRASHSQHSLEELRSQVMDLRTIIDLMKSQHKKEIRQLINELDEEKKIRLSLQMEVEHIKKVLHSK